MRCRRCLPASGWGPVMTDKELPTVGSTSHDFNKHCRTATEPLHWQTEPLAGGEMPGLLPDN